MAHYIRQEMSGKLSRDGKKKYYYRLKCYSNLGTDDVVAHIAECHGFSRGVTEGVLMALSDTIAEFLSKGHHVTVDGLGTFKVSLGETSKTAGDSGNPGNPGKSGESGNPGESGISGKSGKSGISGHPDARRICVRDVLLAADASLTARVDSRITLEHGEDSRLRPSPYTPEERQERARAFMLRQPFMRVADYAALCALSITTAQRELRAWAERSSAGDTLTGMATAASDAGMSTAGTATAASDAGMAGTPIAIRAVGTGSHKVYVLQAAGSNDTARAA